MGTERLDITTQGTHDKPEKHPQQDEIPVLEDCEGKFGGHNETRSQAGSVLILRRSPIQDAGTADGNGVAVKQRGRGNLMPFDECAVRRAEIACDHAVIGDVDFKMLAGDARVVNDDVAAGTTADYRLRLGQQILAAVDFEHRAATGCRL